MRIRTRLRVLSSPFELAALVDLVFLLLIFFMLSSSLVFWPGMRVETEIELPESQLTSMKAADKLVVTITQSDLLFFNDNPVDWDRLEYELHEVVRTGRVASEKRGEGARSPLLVLRADRRIPYGTVVRVMSLARSLGLGVYLVTDPERVARTDTRAIGQDGN